MQIKGSLENALPFGSFLKQYPDNITKFNFVAQWANSNFMEANGFDPEVTIKIGKGAPISTVEDPKFTLLSLLPGAEKYVLQNDAGGFLLRNKR